MKKQLTQYRIETETVEGPERIIEARDAYAALGIFLKRGANGLGKHWTLTRQPNGWIVCSNQATKTLEGTMYRMKEVGWNRHGTYNPR